MTKGLTLKRFDLAKPAKHAREHPAPFDMHVYTDSVQRITIQLARYYGKPSDSGAGSRR